MTEIRVRREIQWLFDMHQNEKGYWDCHGKAYTENPHLILHSFVILDAAIPSGAPTPGTEEKIQAEVAELERKLEEGIKLENQH